MEITRTSVSGVGTMHDCFTRRGAHFRVLEERSGSRTLFVYGPTAAESQPGPDEQFVAIDLDEDEADLFANLLHSKPLRDRVANLERIVLEITEEEN